MASPLSELNTKDVTFHRSEVQQAAFEKLKKKLTTAAVMGLRLNDDKYILDTDASDTTVGAALSQKQNRVVKALAYGSRLLSDTEKNYCITRRELLSKVNIVKYYRAYLLGNTFC